MKTFILIGYSISFFMLGLVLLAYYVNPYNIEPEHFSFPIAKVLMVCAAMTFVGVTPIFFVQMYSNTFNKTEKEITELRERLTHNILLYEKATNKLIKKTLTDE